MKNPARIRTMAILFLVAGLFALSLSVQRTVVAAPAAIPDLLINEVDADQVSTDNAEFLELYDGGVGNTALDGFAVVFYNGSDDLSYTPAFDLDGYTTDANGYFVICGDAANVPNCDLEVGAGTTDLIQNGQDAVPGRRGQLS
jgi:hypothetical protein